MLRCDLEWVLAEHVLDRCDSPLRHAGANAADRFARMYAGETNRFKSPLRRTEEKAIPRDASTLARRRALKKRGRVDANTPMNASATASGCQTPQSVNRADTSRFIDELASRSTLI